MPIVFIASILILVLVSFLMALGSLYAEIAKPKHLKDIKDKLAQEKILFKKK